MIRLESRRVEGEIVKRSILILRMEGEEGFGEGVVEEGVGRDVEEGIGGPMGSGRTSPKLVGGNTLASAV